MKKILISISIAAAIVIVFVLFSNKTPKVTTYSDTSKETPNVVMENDKQVIEIKAKGGYSPSLSIAKANVPTILRVTTNSSFDCSSALRIPAIGYSKNLPPTGTTDIELPTQAAGTTLKALCSMGMYNFSIQFKG